MFEKSYIDKCWKADVLQENWKPSYYDEVGILARESNQRFIAQYHVTMPNHLDTEQLITLNGSIIIKSECVWLPTTYQLIKMCHSLGIYHSEWRLLSQMKLSLPKTYCTCNLKNMSIVELWLLFYMKQKYNLKWMEASKKWMG